MGQNTKFNEIVPCLHSTDKQSGQQQVLVQAVYIWIIPMTCRHASTCGLITRRANTGIAAMLLLLLHPCGSAVRIKSFMSVWHAPVTMSSETR